MKSLNMIFYKSGFTLIEMALAITVAAAFMMTAAVTMSSALRIQNDAEKMRIASSLAETKMAQLLANPELVEEDSSGSLGDKAGIYSGYEYKVSVKEESIDLNSVMEQGSLSGTSVKDKLPGSVQNFQGKERISKGMAALGEIKVLHIIVVIRYPIGANMHKNYRVETYRKSVSRRSSDVIQGGS